MIICEHEYVRCEHCGALKCVKCGFVPLSTTVYYNEYGWYFTPRQEDEDEPVAGTA